MNNFLKKIYSIFLRQNSWWLDDFIATPNRPLLAGLFLFVGYVLMITLMDITTTSTITGIVLSITLLLISVTGILWLRENRFPPYITGILRGSHQYQKIQTIFLVIFSGGLGLLLLFSTLMDW